MRNVWPIVFLVGCATQGTSTFNHVQSAAKTVVNEKTVSRPQTAVWDELVRELSKSFYVINNIERESRIINVSFSSNTPAAFIDCGQTSREYRQGDNVERYNYAVAEKSTYKMATPKQPHPAFAYYALIEREPMLEGRSNIYVAPVPNDPQKTTVSVNTRYILNIKARGQVYAQHVSGNTNMTNERISERTTTEMFNTNKPSSRQEQGVTIVCAGSGKLEQDILDMVK